VNADPVNTELVAAASAACGQALSDPVALAGSERSVVLRCQGPAGSTVIVKAYLPAGDGPAGFTAEAAGLEFTTGTGSGPDLLATDPERLLIVMSDLGAVPSLADALLGAAPALAGEQVLRWTRACGSLAVSTAGREDEFSRLRSRHAGEADPVLPEESGHWLQRRIWEIPALLEGLSIAAPDGLTDDLARVAALMSVSEYSVFSPGDLCPDNNLVTADGIRFIDFESAEFHSAFLDAAFLSMPFSSCWCVFRLPPDLARTALATYREAVSGLFPPLASDAVWLPGLRLAQAAWTLHAMSYLLDRSMVADGSMNPLASEAPTARQLLRYRWTQLGDELSRAGELPAICALMSALLTVSEPWQSPALPLYPAFR
jgi:hypothetical protein